MNKLMKLLDNCACGVYITFNEHRDCYLTAAEELEDLSGHGCPPNLASEVRQVMVDTDTIIRIQVYPHTPVGSYTVYHYDLDSALAEALDCLGLTY
jgi:hypothetical protein